MNPNDIPSGTRFLLDANILIYAKDGLSEECRQLLARCETGDVRGYVSAVAVAEFSHRRMMQEAQSLGLISSNPARALAQNRTLIAKLGKYQREVQQILAGDLAIIELTSEDLNQALEIQRRCFLLTNDSLLVAAAQRMGIRIIVSNDPQFDSVPGITRHAPTDMIVM